MSLNFDSIEIFQKLRDMGRKAGKKRGRKKKEGEERKE